MLWSVIYLVIITIAEALTASIMQAQEGIILHGVILVILILQGATTRQIHLRRMLLILSLAPLIRILSISLPLGQIDNFVYWYLIIGTLLYMGAFYTAQVSGFSYKRMGFTLKGWVGQLPIALIGFGLGLIEYFILRPAPLILQWDWGQFLFAAIVLMIFTGLLEEFIFRGLVQEAAIATMGAWGILYGAVLFAVLHLGYRSWQDTLFVFTVGGIFGIIVQRTRSLLGVTLAHGFTNISMYLIFPFLITSIPQQTLIQSIPQMATPAVISVPGIVAPLPSGAGHFPGRYVTSTPAISPTPSPSATPIETMTPIVFPTITSFPSTAVICTIPHADWVIYTVQSGDTLSIIASRYGVTVAQLQSVNCLRSTVIVAGQRLYVPGGIAPTEQPTQIIITDTSVPTEEVSPTVEMPLPTTEPPTPTIEIPPTETPAVEPPTPNPTTTP